MRTWQDKFKRMRAFLYSGLLAPQIIGILLAWQQQITLSWPRLILACVLNLTLFAICYGYLIKPDRQQRIDWYAILLGSLTSSLFVVSAYVLQGNQLGGAIILASLPIGLYAAVVVYLQQFSALRSRSQIVNVPSATKQARLVGAVLIALITLTILLASLLGIYPWYASISILTTLPLLIALYQIDQDLQLRISVSGAYWQTMLLFSIALLIHALIGV